MNVMSVKFIGVFGQGSPGHLPRGVVVRRVTRHVDLYVLPFRGTPAVSRLGLLKCLFWTQALISLGFTSRKIHFPRWSEQVALLYKAYVL